MSNNNIINSDTSNNNISNTNNSNNNLETILKQQGTMELKTRRIKKKIR